MRKVKISKKYKTILLPWSEKIGNLIPHAKKAIVKGIAFGLVPHKFEEVRLLRNIGYSVPAPVASQYAWAGAKPFDSQRTTAEMLTMCKRAYVLSSMGTGKTLASLFAADYLIKTGVVSKVLVVAPLSTLSPTWMNEIFLRFRHRKAVVLHGTRARRLRRLAEDADFYIINHDGIATIFDELQARRDINLIILDELAVFRDASTDRWKRTRLLLEGRRFVWGMTGAPIPNAPTDAYGQIKLLHPHRVRSFRQFQSDTMIQRSQYMWTPKRNASEYVHDLMQPSVRFKLSDCVDIPETTYSTRDVVLSKQQTKFYDALMDKLAIEYKGHQVTAVNEGVKLSKLLQIAGGWVYTAEKKVLDLSPTSRMRELELVVEQSENKVIVFAPYLSACNQLHKFLSKRWDVALITSGTSKPKRDIIFREFQMLKQPHVIVAHPGTMSHGLTLTAATTIVWYLPSPSLDTYIQANARIPRPGQKFKTNIVHLCGTPIEKKVYSRLQSRQRLQGVLLGMFEETTAEGIEFT